MSNYLNWDEKNIKDSSAKSVTEMYGRGYVFTRLDKGVMHQTRSVRIDLSKFNLSSENRRILKKVANLSSQSTSLPMKDYDWQIGKMAKDFYDTKFGEGIMSAQKVKEMLTDKEKSNFNVLLKFNVNPERSASTGTESGPLAGSSFSAAFASSERPVSTDHSGFTICYSNDTILHYSYPFYDLKTAPKDMGLAMMTMTIQKMKESGLEYVYLGSLQRPGDTYKLQFEGLEWFDGKVWSSDLEEAKNILRQQAAQC